MNPKIANIMKEIDQLRHEPFGVPLAQDEDDEIMVVRQRLFNELQDCAKDENAK